MALCYNSLNMTEINYTPIINFEIPKLNNDQLAKFTMESIYAKEVMKFDPVQAVQVLEAKSGTKVIGADFGGDKGVSQLFEIVNGTLQLDDSFRQYKQGSGGEGYLEVLKEAENFAAQNGIGIGISWGTPVDGTKPGYHSKIDAFYNELSSQYDGDFANLVPHLTIALNDGPAGLISGAVEAYRELGAKNILFPINGGGLGMGVLKDGVMYATEAGHVEALSELNIFNRTGECGIFDQKFICIEMLGANKAGIEPQWMDQTGQEVSARQIETLFLEGNELAGKIYDHSALIMAHMVVGTANAFGIDLSSSETAIVGHGGGFKFPHYGDRVSQIIANEGHTPHLIMTKDFGNEHSNACLDGAAIAALVTAQ